MNRKVALAPGEFYHLYNRGNDRRTIFMDEKDADRFVELLYLANGVGTPQRTELARGVSVFDIARKETYVDIGAYCLMPNHFHLLVYEKKESGISTFMQRLQTAYSMYFNKRHDRTGKLFEGVFKSEHADEDVYLHYLFSYIHLNPIKLIDPAWKDAGISDLAKAKDFLRTYPYSSYHEYTRTEKRKQSGILQRTAFPDYFQSNVAFEKFIEEWLLFRNITTHI